MNTKLNPITAKLICLISATFNWVSKLLKKSSFPIIRFNLTNFLILLQDLSVLQLGMSQAIMKMGTGASCGGDVAWPAVVMGAEAGQKKIFHQQGVFSSL